MTIRDAVELLRLEARTVWGHGGDTLRYGTVQVAAITYDGRAELIPGPVPLRAGVAVSVTLSQLSRCHAVTLSRAWVLDATPELPCPSGLRVVTDGHASLRAPKRWAPTEWTMLLAGESGPWAAVADGNRVVSLAHCARLTDEAAEVGVQTEPDVRGNGLARVAVSAWTRTMAPLQRMLFYSAVEANIASHRVAAGVAARPIGLLARTHVETAD